MRQYVKNVFYKRPHLNLRVSGPLQFTGRLFLLHIQHVPVVGTIVGRVLHLVRDVRKLARTCTRHAQYLLVLAVMRGIRDGVSACHRGHRIRGHGDVPELDVS